MMARSTSLLIPRRGNSWLAVPPGWKQPLHRYVNDKDWGFLRFYPLHLPVTRRCGSRYRSRCPLRRRTALGQRDGAVEATGETGGGGINILECSGVIGQRGQGGPGGQ